MLENMLNWGRKIALAGAMTTASVMGYAETQEQENGQEEVERKRTLIIAENPLPGSGVSVETRVDIVENSNKIGVGGSYSFGNEEFGPGGRAWISVLFPLSDDFYLGPGIEGSFASGKEKVISKHEHKYDEDSNLSEICEDPDFSDYEICKNSVGPHRISQNVNVNDGSYGLGASLIGLYKVPKTDLEISAALGLDIIFGESHIRTDALDPDGNTIRDLSGNESSTHYEGVVNTDLALNSRLGLGYLINKNLTLKGNLGWSTHLGFYLGADVGFDY